MRPRAYLSTQDAIHYAARLTALGCWRVTTFPIGNGRAMIEIRPMPGRRPQAPALCLRTAEECERVLAQVEA